MNSSNAKSVILAMVEALNKHMIDGQEAFWKEDAVWRGPAGAGVKESLRHFQEGWQRPFLEAFPDKANEYRGGKTGLMGFFTGQIMKETQGRADPRLVQDLFRQRLES